MWTGHYIIILYLSCLCGFHVSCVWNSSCLFPLIKCYIFLKNISNDISFRAGVPNPQASDRYWSMACWELGPPAGGEQQASKQSFICRSPSLTLSPAPSPPHPPCPWKNRLPQNQSLVPKRLGTAALGNILYSIHSDANSFFYKPSQKFTCNPFNSLIHFSIQLIFTEVGCVSGTGHWGYKWTSKQKITPRYSMQVTVRT